jgi:hypothetical protein
MAKTTTARRIHQEHRSHPVLTAPCHRHKFGHLPATTLITHRLNRRMACLTLIQHPLLLSIRRTAAHHHLLCTVHPGTVGAKPVRYRTHTVDTTMELPPCHSHCQLQHHTGPFHKTRSRRTLLIAVSKAALGIMAVTRTKRILPATRTSEDRGLQATIRLLARVSARTARDRRQRRHGSNAGRLRPKKRVDLYERIRDRSSTGSRHVTDVFVIGYYTLCYCNM